MNNFWEKRNVLITGASGFVGSWISKELINKNGNVVALVKDIKPGSLLNSKEISSKLKAVIDGDVRNYELVEDIFNKYEIDTCFHLAAQAIVGVANKSPILTFESNIQGTWNILEIARVSKSLKIIVVASSDKAYGTHEELPYTEENCLLGLHPYDASKACADILARTYANTYGLPVTVTRFANIYGGGDLNFSRIVPDTIKSVLLNKNPIIRSDGTPIRDYIYIKDVVNGYLTLAEQTEKENIKGQAFNFGTGKPISVLDLVNKIIKISGKSLKPEILGKGKLKGEIDKQYLSSEKAKKLLKWKAKYDLDVGLKETIEWYRNILILGEF